MVELIVCRFEMFELVSDTHFMLQCALVLTQCDWVQCVCHWFSRLRSRAVHYVTVHLC